MDLIIEPFEYGPFNKGLKLSAEFPRASEEAGRFSWNAHDLFLANDGTVEFGHMRVKTDEALEWLEAAAKFIRENRERVES